MEAMGFEDIQINLILSANVLLSEGRAHSAEM